MPTRASAVFRDIPFAELRLGERRRTRYELGLDMVSAFYSITRRGERDEPLKAGDPVPPAVYSTFLPLFHALGGRMEQGTIHTHQSVELAAASAYVGDVLDVEVTVVRAEVSGGRRRVEIATEFRREGRLVCRTRSRYLWGYSAPREGER